MNLTAFEKSQFKGLVKETVNQAEALRRDKDHPVDISFADMVQAKHNVTLENFLGDLGINPAIDTIQNIFTSPDPDVRWVVPEIIREALLLGYRAAPIWPSIIAAEENTTGLTQIMPHLNMSDATPRRVGEAETISVGMISYGQKKFSIYKIGKGIKIPYEVSQYSTLNVVKIFLRDFGLKLGHAQDTLAIDCLINGEQADGSESAPVIGIGTANTKAYRDFLKIWIRLARMGRIPTTILGGKDAAIDTLDLTEFKTRQNAGPTVATINLKTPVPTSMNYFIHGNIPTKQEIILDPTSCLIKFNAQPLLVESEKIVSNQTEAFYATLTSGFAKLFRDAAVIMDSSLAFSGNGFPTYMDVDPFQNITIE
jgi:hypothetical protein